LHVYTRIIVDQNHITISDMNRIKEILKIQGRSQAWLAEQIGRSYVVTTNYCNNKTQPSLFILRKIAKALDVDIRDLLSQTKDGVLSMIMRTPRSKNNTKRSSRTKTAASSLRTNKLRKALKKSPRTAHAKKRV
jgi:putative transcriptional regulator